MSDKIDNEEGLQQETETGAVLHEVQNQNRFLKRANNALTGALVAFGLFFVFFGFSFARFYDWGVEQRDRTATEGRRYAQQLVDTLAPTDLRVFRCDTAHARSYFDDMAAALKYCGENPPGRVFIPSGDYRGRKVLEVPAYTTLSGALSGDGKTVLHGMSLHLTGSEVIVEKLVLARGDSPETSPIVADNLIHDVRIANSAFIGWPGAMVRFENASDTSGVFVFGNYTTSRPPHLPDCTNCDIHGNFFEPLSESPQKLGPWTVRYMSSPSAVGKGSVIR